MHNFLYNWKAQTSTKKLTKRLTKHRGWGGPVPGLSEENLQLGENIRILYGVLF